MIHSQIGTKTKTKGGEKMKLIPIAERNNYQCRLCGETRSVKYFIETVDPLEGSEPFYAPYCNKCALRHTNNHNEEEQ